MAFFRKRDRANGSDWTPVEIHIVSGRPVSTNIGGNETHWHGDLIEIMSGTRYHFVLEVRPPGGTPYRIAHNETVPRRVVRPGLSTEQKVPDGIDRPGWVRVDNPQKVAIDWTGYGSTTEAKAAIADARTIDEDLNYARMLAKQKPKLQEKLRASTWAGTSEMATVVRDGTLARDVWEEQAQSNLRKTLITPDQYAEARAIFEK